MKGLRIHSLIFAVGSLLVLGCLTPQTAKAQTPLFRLSSEFSEFDGFEIFTDLAPPGVVFYKKSLFVGANTVYVTISASAQSAGNLLLSCAVDGAFCNPGTSFFPGIPGWVMLDTVNINFNNINYQWCKAVSPGTHTISLSLASTEVDGTVFIQNAHFYIDTSNLNGGCTKASTQGATTEP